MNHFGLDIGSQNIKLVELKKDVAGRMKLSAFGMASTPANALVSESKTDQKKLHEALKTLLLSAKVNTDRVVFSPPEDQVFTRIKRLPKLTEQELTAAIRWEADQDIPLPLEEVYLTHQVIDSDKKAQDENSQMEVMIVAVPKIALDRHLATLKAVGLKTAAVETETLALSRALVTRLENPPTTLLINIGAQATNLAVVSLSRLVFTRSIKTAGLALTRAIQTELGLDIVQAAEYKKSYGLDESKIEGKVARALKPVFEVIVSEIHRAIAAYASKGEDSIKRVVLAGGSAMLPNLVLFLAENLNLEVQLGNPWFNIDRQVEDQEAMAQTAPYYSVAVGLGLKEI